MKRRVIGKRAVHEALLAQGELHVVYVSEKGGAGLADLVNLARRTRIAVEEVSSVFLSHLAKDLPHQGIVAIAGSYSYMTLETLCESAEAGPKHIVALDEITDPHNLGAIIRSAVAFGFLGIIIPRHRAASVTATVVRASAGCTERARVARVSNISKALTFLREQHGYEAVGLDAQAEIPLQALAASDRNRVLVVGSEGRGLRRLVSEHCDQLVRIDMKGRVNSLNASVAAAIAMYSLSTAPVP
ncbi:MAG: 23S rRNA (guanosine(2251)-2'-O)-methyltransferase RlmB [Myxococcales bacterium]|nr:23S rRNA (guanosine(2251)-2'-O)-methyltransferase RlmB [Myxococcales bacterium]MCB9708101.1 23S rRNA (guanosine(2251)-2'-O)-methyltransferase RlmB [Myxococcales bacterium]